MNKRVRLQGTRKMGSKAHITCLYVPCLGHCHVVLCLVRYACRLLLCQNLSIAFSVCVHYHMSCNFCLTRSVLQHHTQLFLCVPMPSCFKSHTHDCSFSVGEWKRMKRKTETENGNGKLKFGNGRQKFNRLVSGQCAQ